jgi:hypothetical protein
MMWCDCSTSEGHGRLGRGPGVAVLVPAGDYQGRQWHHGLPTRCGGVCCATTAPWACARSRTSPSLVTPSPPSPRCAILTCYGPIPGHLVNLSGLVHVNLSHNYFSSGFPTDGIRQLQNLCCIDLRNNSVWHNGSDLLTELCNDEHIDASHNLFTSLELAN